MNDPTIDYYERNAAAYAEATFGLDMATARDRFARLLPPGGSLLDAGCGAGRDALAFKQAGFAVTASEPSAALAAIAAATTGLDVLQARFQELDFRPEFDGVWACASLLHVPAAEMPEVFRRLANALRPAGVFYCSFKEADRDFSDEHGRLFTAGSVARLESWAAPSGRLRLAQTWRSDDLKQRPGTRWLNAIFALRT